MKNFLFLLSSLENIQKIDNFINHYNFFFYFFSLLKQDDYKIFSTIKTDTIHRNLIFIFF